MSLLGQTAPNFNLLDTGRELVSLQAQAQYLNLGLGVNAVEDKTSLQM